MIEHRHAKRVALSKDVSIYHRGNFIATCRAINISLDGLALWSGSFQYQRNTVLDVEISCDENSHDPVLLPAIVVHTSGNVLGLMFRQVDDQAKQFIRYLINNNDENNAGALVAMVKGGDWSADELDGLQPI